VPVRSSRRLDQQLLQAVIVPDELVDVEANANRGSISSDPFDDIIPTPVSFFGECLAPSLTAGKLLFQILILRGDAFAPPADIDDDGPITRTAVAAAVARGHGGASIGGGSGLLLVGGPRV